MFIRITLLLLILFSSTGSFSQKIISEEEVVKLALTNSKNISASELVIVQQRQLLKGSFNLPNPELFLESPTGNFYTGSITQSFEFPSVYTKQYQLQKQRIVLAEKEKNISELELKYQVKQLYLLLQYIDALQNQLYTQDTVYAKMAIAAGRQFDAGQIDYLQKVFTETQYGEIHNQYLQSQISSTYLQAQLQYIIGLQVPLKPTQISRDQTSNDLKFDTAEIIKNPTIELYRQNVIISEKNIALKKSQALPGLAFGYFNQGERTTPFMNRFRLGITLPLWYGQYKANINAAKTESQIAKLKTTGLQQQLMIQLNQAQNELALNEQSLKYYENTGNKKAEEILSTAQRFFESGETDYINYLRNINDAYQIKLKYLEAQKKYKQSILYINYLTGTL